VLNYWGIRKPREIPELIAQQLDKAISGGASLTGAMQSFAKERGFGLKVEQKSRDSAEASTRATFTDVRMEADSGRPFLITVANKLPDGKSVSATYAGAGYAVDQLGQWLIVHTGISPSESIAETDSSAPWCRHGVIFLNWDCAVDSLTVTTVQVNREVQTIVK